MRVGVISDVHSNRVALERVLSDMPDVDELVCAGDVVGYNPWPGECVDTLRERGVPTVMGNHDRAATVGSPRGFNAMGKAGIAHTREVLNDVQREWVASLPEELTRFDGRVKIVHSHPHRRGRYTYPEEFGPDLLGEESVLILGHTHVQAHERFDEGIVMNPGSVGQPRDGDPRAAYAVLDLEELTVTEGRVEYDIGAVQEAVEAAGLPRRIGDRLENGQ